MLRFHLPSSMAVVLLIVALTSSVDSAQSGVAGTSSGTGVVSPAVVAPISVFSRAMVC
jgi:hypothetical protein